MTDQASGGTGQPELVTRQARMPLRLTLPEYWLDSTAWLQHNFYGYDEPENMDEASIANYIDWNQVAAVQELAELREEFSWKPWATDEPFVHRERILAEAVDVLHFIGNILVACGVSDEDFWTAYRDKQNRNIQRANSGTYSALKGGLSQGSDG